MEIREPSYSISKPRCADQNQTVCSLAPYYEGILRYENSSKSLASVRTSSLIMLHTLKLTAKPPEFHGGKRKLDLASFLEQKGQFSGVNVHLVLGRLRYRVIHNDLLPEVGESPNHKPAISLKQISKVDGRKWIHAPTNITNSM